MGLVQSKQATKCYDRVVATQANCHFDDLEALLNLGAHDLDGCRDLLAYSHPSTDDHVRRGGARGRP